MENLNNKLNELNNQFETIKNKIDNKLNSIKNEIEKFNYIKEVSVGFSWRNISISITPKSAWSDVMRLEIYSDKNEFHTSSGGWNNPENALVEFASISNDLVNFMKEFDYNIVNDLKELNNKLSEIRNEIEKIEKQIKLEKLTKNKRKLIEEEIEKVLKVIKEGKNIIIYTHFYGNKLEKETISYYNRRYRVDGVVLTKKEIINRLKEGFVNKDFSI